jgi:hypothetical protein
MPSRPNSTTLPQPSVRPVQQNANTGEEARAVAKDAVEVSKSNLEMPWQIKRTGTLRGSVVSYATMAVRGETLAGIPNTQDPRIPSVQTQREVIVTLRDPTIAQALKLQPTPPQRHQDSNTVVAQQF